VAEVAWAILCHNQGQAQAWRARLDVHLAVDTWLPELLVVPDPGESESTSAAARVQAGRIYLYDRGFSGYEVINAHYDLDQETPTLQVLIRLFGVVL
jgi:hypothetical protein